MAKTALLGAGGKMGVRLSWNLENAKREVAHVEVSDAGRERLKAELGFDCVPLDDEEAARKDFFGGVLARQNIVCALMQGPEEDYAHCEDIARDLRAGDAVAPLLGRGHRDP